MEHILAQVAMPKSYTALSDTLLAKNQSGAVAYHGPPSLLTYVGRLPAIMGPLERALHSYNIFQPARPIDFIATTYTLASPVYAFTATPRNRDGARIRSASQVRAHRTPGNIECAS